jgi:hypothetical protein
VLFRKPITFVGFKYYVVWYELAATRNARLANSVLTLGTVKYVFVLWAWPRFLANVSVKSSESRKWRTGHKWLFPSSWCNQPPWLQGDESAFFCLNVTFRFASRSLSCDGRRSTSRPFRRITSTGVEHRLCRTTWAARGRERVIPKFTDLGSQWSMETVEPHYLGNGAFCSKIDEIFYKFGSGNCNSTHGFHW